MATFLTVITESGSELNTILSHMSCSCTNRALHCGRGRLRSSYAGGFVKWNDQLFGDEVDVNRVLLCPQFMSVSGI